jgi:hypothetical protein
MSQADIERRRQAWLAFASSAIAGYEPMKEKYRNADEIADEIVSNCSALADDMLAEYAIREKNDFEVDDFDEEDEDDPDEEDDEEEEDEEEERPAKRRTPAKKSRR